MDRKKFLKGISTLSLGALIPIEKAKGAINSINKLGKETNTCVLTPTEVAGPYRLNLSSNAAMFRQDIRETKAGIQLNLNLRLVNSANCLPLQNLRVDIWHCDADGYYSGFSNSGYLGTQNNVGLRFLRGIQLSDANGDVNFTTILPGWYPTRVCHIHYQIFLSSILQATSQFTFPEALKNSLYTSNPLYSVHGADPQPTATDPVFSDGSTYQEATLTPNLITGGYDSFLQVAINSAITTNLQKLEPETGGQFKLEQNYPNPYLGKTAIPFNLTNASDVNILLFDLQGKKVAEIIKNNLSAGHQEIEIDILALGIAQANYAYQIEVKNDAGTFSQCKIMTAE